MGVDIFLQPKELRIKQISPKNSRSVDPDAEQRERIIDVLRNKFKHFQNKPNEKQIVKLGDISLGLREHFFVRRESTSASQYNNTESNDETKDEYDPERYRDWAV